MYIKIFSLTVEARATLQNFPYSKRSTCFTFNIVTLSFTGPQSCSFRNYSRIKDLKIWRFSWIFDLSSKFLCPSKALEAFKVSHSTGIIAEQKISKSNFVQNITSNVIFRFPEGQPTHWLSFSIFEIFVLPSKFFMPQ